MTQIPTRFEALQLVFAHFRTQPAMAEAFGVSQPTIWRWMNQSKQMPPEFVLLAESITGVPRHFLRPDIYPVDLPPAAPWVGYDHGSGDRSAIVAIHPRHNGNRTNVLDKTALRRMAR
jgi:DNA-binding transcriptional regulator YdaS (Cro superfamily)